MSIYIKRFFFINHLTNFCLNKNINFKNEIVLAKNKIELQNFLNTISQPLKLDKLCFTKDLSLMSNSNLYEISMHRIYDEYIKSCSILSTHVFRIENEDGEGFYSDKYKFFKGYSNLELHPSPNDDTNFKNILNSDNPYKNEWLFAFENLDDVNSWINGPQHPKINKELDFYHFKIVKINIPISYVIKGIKQCIFNKNHALSKNYLSLDLISPDLYHQIKQNKLKK